MYRVAGTHGSVAANSTGSQSWQSPSPIGQNTRLMLLLPGQEGAGDQNVDRADGSSSSSSSRRDVVAVAREAAKAVAKGSSQEAAMEAAERAVRAGGVLQF